MRLFDDERYLRLARAGREQFARAEPFPHAVMDDFLPAAVAERVLTEFPAPRQAAWQRTGSFDQQKLAAQREDQFGDFIRDVLRACNAVDCLRFLEDLTGIAGLMGDPYFEGGGLHQIERGGFLKVHADFNWHKRLKLDRRLNLIVYLNKGWRDEYRGHLELWDRTMSRCVKKVLPAFNRAVVFATTSWAFHGHPERLACPEGMTRKSLALYFYTNGRPEEEKNDAHGVLWQERRGGWEGRRWSAALLRGVAGLLERPAKWLRRRANKLSGKRSDAA
jgi:Rps23 Pro-64 3,4-dihydroxylase Tpa1-like proline 4-hydroxylase